MFPVWGSDRGTICLVWTDDCGEVELLEYADSAEGRDTFTDLHSLVEDAAADLNHLQVLLLLIPRTLDVRHPAPLVLLTGIDEIPDGPVLVKHLRGWENMSSYTMLDTCFIIEESSLLLVIEITW